MEKITKMMEIIMPKLNSAKQIFFFLMLAIFMTLADTLIHNYVEKGMIDNVTSHVDVQVRNTVEEVVDESTVSYENKIEEAIISYPEIDIHINNLLDRINNNLGTGKAAVGIYHDGVKSPKGNPFLKYSITNERILEKVVAVNHSQEFSQGSSVPYAKISYYAYRMQKDGFFICNDVKELDKISKPDLYQAKQANIKSLAALPLIDDTENSKVKIVGFLIVFSYDEEVDFKHELEYLQFMSELIMDEVNFKYGNR